jgi:NAD(P)-dependent dehydrogenase (short-subunit alcohol dehydrogenase family)
LAFAREGAKVIVADVALTGGEETVRMIRAANGEAVFCRADVSKAAEVEALIRTAVATYGRLDCAHNNAGVESIAGATLVPTVDLTEENWDYTININLKGVWLCMKYEIPQMLSQGHGTIVNTASILGLVGFQTAAAYVASKHGVMGLTKTAALEYAQAGIRINAVCPGFIHTAMVERVLALLSRANPHVTAQVTALHPIGCLGTPAEVAEAVLWLCSDAASFMTGQTMTVDGGYVAQ